MKTALIISSSLFGSESQSYQLADSVIAKLQRQHGPIRRIERDLSDQPVPHLDASTFAAFSINEAERTDAQRQAVALSDQLIAELKRADFIVLAVPMYNFGVPSALKAWFDHIARAGHTFTYTSNGSQGLLNDRPVFVIATRGGRYAGTPNDLQSPFLRQILGFVGLSDLRFVYAEGLAMNDFREQSLAEAGRQIQAIAA